MFVRYGPCMTETVGTCTGVTETARECSMGGCERPSAVRGLCKSHYMQWYRGGKLKPLAIKGVPLVERFWRHVAKSDGDGCWMWTAGTGGNGYGYIRDDLGVARAAHRIAYELTHGHIPAGLDIDHTCRNRACVNPHHLQSVTRKQNLENRSSFNPKSASNIRGVHRNGGNHWSVRIGHNGALHYGGRFTSLADAERAAVALRNSLHTNNIADREDVA